MIPAHGPAWVSRFLLLLFIGSLLGGTLGTQVPITSVFQDWWVPAQAQRCLLPLFIQIARCQPRHPGTYYLCSSGLFSANFVTQVLITFVFSGLLCASLGTYIAITFVFQDCSVQAWVPKYLLSLFFRIARCQPRCLGTYYLCFFKIALCQPWYIRYRLPLYIRIARCQPRCLGSYYFCKQDCSVPAQVPRYLSPL